MTENSGNEHTGRGLLWFSQVRGPFLILSLVLVLVGVAAAFHDGFFHWIWALIIAAGVVLAHIAVNLFNEISDFKTGIDSRTKRTPFSGGSGLMQAGATRPEQVTVAAYAALMGAGLMGALCIWRAGWFILLFIIPGALAIRFYTPYLARWLVGEVAAGLTLGSMVVAGTYFVMSARITGPILMISLPPGILTSLLLFLNEFPDLEADQAGGRHHLVIHFGRRRSALIYTIALIILYLLIGAAPLISTLPQTLWLGLLTVPMAFIASRITLRHYNQFERLIPALALNVGVVILTDLLLAVAFFL